MDTNHLSQEKPASFCRLRAHLNGASAIPAEEIRQWAKQCEGHRHDLEVANEQLRSTQQQLERYRDRYIRLYDFAPLGYVTLDEDGYVQEINLAGARMLAVAHNELIGYSLLDFVAEANRQAFLEHIHKCIRTRQETTTETHLKANDGRRLIVQLHSMPVEEDDGEVTFCKTAITDITERYRVEESLRQTEERLRLAITAAEMGTWQWNLSTDVLTVDERGKALLGLAPAEELNREVLFRIIHPDDRSLIQERLVAAELQPGEYESEFRAVWPDGSIHWIYGKGRSTHDEQGQVSLAGVSLDVTARKEAEEQIRILSRLPEENPHPVLRIARDGTISYANPASTPLLVGWKIQPGQKMPEPWPAQVAAVLQSGVMEKIKVSSGDRIFLCVLVPVVEADYLNVYGSDITELTQVQQRILEIERAEKHDVEAERNTIREQLTRQTRLATIGQAYVGLAHELRNPLWAIHLGLGMLKEEVPEKAKQGEFLALLEQELETARQIIDRLTALSRGQPPVKAAVDLHAIVHAAQRHLPIPSGITWHYCCQPDPFVIPAEAVLLEQVFRNLFANALEAMGGSGTITITANRAQSEDEILVADTGPGIPQELQDRLFEPLITTKPEGTGLGLALSRQIIERHGGTIQLLPNEAAGAVFQIRLPAGETSD